ncbi:uncharacterized protein BYT42DRAFT_616633 [Radiomyces spectabilis]|uniref:uncharacterized protein n=1 Tax=Radiomyces spectabilis TaxID=64574 RepID=UPI002220AB51|nr:uncharacterized protein BYT42DRAFT_616633 [Radiomyces spectabilis]KAI8371546.1 hypothetical protein BYT42DRAFT_616633 [Radiomyces spectabilis]
MTECSAAAASGYLYGLFGDEENGKPPEVGAAQEEIDGAISIPHHPTAYHEKPAINPEETFASEAGTDHARIVDARKEYAKHSFSSQCVYDLNSSGFVNEAVQCRDRWICQRFIYGEFIKQMLERLDEESSASVDIPQMSHQTEEEPIFPPIVMELMIEYSSSFLLPLDVLEYSPDLAVSSSSSKEGRLKRRKTESSEEEDYSSRPTSPITIPRPSQPAQSPPLMGNSSSRSTCSTTHSKPSLPLPSSSSSSFSKSLSAACSSNSVTPAKPTVSLSAQGSTPTKDPSSLRIRKSARLSSSSAAQLSSDPRCSSADPTTTAASQTSQSIPQFKDSDITHDVQNFMFKIQLDSKGSIAALCYLPTRYKRVLEFYHTEIPVNYRNMGIGDLLVQHALQWAESSQVLVLPVCPFVSRHLQIHNQRTHPWSCIVSNEQDIISKQEQSIVD